MRKATLYSRSNRPRRPAGRNAPAGAAEAPAAPPAPRRKWPHWRKVFAGTALAGIAAALLLAWPVPPKPLTQEDIDAAVMRTLENNTLPSRMAKAYDVIRPSVVRVRGLGKDEMGEEVEQSVGTGVVIVDSGIILTNLHVVAGAPKLMLEFADGLEAEATVIGLQPEQDLAVLQAKTIPDDLVAATMRSTQDLALGEDVMAVGFPFGIGPSVSSGVVSGLRREYRSPEGKRVLTNLIQFDAAANPGNSGGPLVTAEGEVVGIVTGLLNPTEQRVFIGIGFAVPIESAAGAVGLSPF
ncbi:MAG TPA: trypsin-like peptidase domain-containing protein [Luteimonas sp.]|nr:trypsin-like peptidase domain-containing protein [Luteimonas sp.]